MSVRITEIRFLNYRQYGTLTINFDTTGREHELVACIAKNGTGKTTMLKGITWCLYGKEYPEADDKGLELINSAVAREMPEEKRFDVAVSIKLTDDDQTIVFTRTKGYMKRSSFKDQTNLINDGKSEFTASVTKNDGTNSSVLRNEEADAIVTQYFDQAIRGFYFFDGEKLKEFFKQANNVKDSVFNISQVTRLKTAIDHVEAVRNDLQREASRDNPNAAKLAEERDAFIRDRKEQENILSKSDAAYKKMNLEYNDISEELRSYQPISAKQKRKDELTKALEGLRRENDQVKDHVRDFVREYEINLRIYPYARQALSIIEANTGDTSKISFSVSQIRDLLEHQGDPCPLCDNVMGERSIKHLNELLNSITSSVSSLSYLSAMRGYLEDVIEDVRQYTARKQDILDEQRDIDQKIRRCEEELDAVSSFLSGNQHGDGSFDVPKAERRQDELKQLMEEEIKKQTIAQNKLTEDNARIEALGKAIDAANMAMIEKEETQRQIDLLTELLHHFIEVRDNIMRTIKDDISQKTWKYFKNMIWKKNTFKKLTIDDDYHVRIFNIDDSETTGDLSETERMAEAYSFVFAVHESSGRNCPLIIDSPLGKTSDDNREKIAGSLLEVSRDKQIIMLFTPDEYSQTVSSQYDDNVIKKYLRLSDDESYVMEETV